MLRLAASFVPSRAVAEEVVQDTWLALLRGLDTFEGRSSLKTWLFSILLNQARSTGTREHRSVPIADPEPAVDPARFDVSGHWAEPPEHWTEAIEGRLAAASSPTASVSSWTNCRPAAGGRHPARRRGDEQRRGLLGAGHQRWEPAGPPAPRPEPPQAAVRGRVPGGTMRILLRRDLVCRQAVELVTDYLGGALSRRARQRFEAHLPALHRVPGSDARNDPAHRSPGAGGPYSAAAGRVRRAVPPVAGRAAVRRPRRTAVMPTAPSGSPMPGILRSLVPTAIKPGMTPASDRLFGSPRPGGAPP
jgi:hypothetical protein